MDLKEQIDQEACSIAGKLIEIRRDIHQLPELGFEEHRTSDLVARELTEAGLVVRRNVGQTGVVGLINGGDGPCFALRADMDALPIQEENDLPFKSENEGVMHACGHDIHTTVLTGVGLVLQRLKDRLPGKAKLVFQPSEEKISGAAAMLEDGVMEDPKIDAICAVHVDGDYTWDTVALRYGENLAAADRIDIDILGKGTHGAMPHEGNDPILAGAAVITALQQAVSRRTNPVEPAVVSVCQIEGGTAFNIVPPKVTMAGTVRTLTKELRQNMEEWLPQIVRDTAAAHGCQGVAKYTRGCPPLTHDDALTALAEETLREALGAEKVLLKEKPMMGAEDFAFFAERVPATQIVLGIKENADAPKVTFHDPAFIADERCITTGVRALCSLAIGYLLA